MMSYICEICIKHVNAVSNQNRYCLKLIDMAIFTYILSS